MKLSQKFWLEKGKILFSTKHTHKYYLLKTQLSFCFIDNLTYHKFIDYEKKQNVIWQFGHFGPFLNFLTITALLALSCFQIRLLFLALKIFANFLCQAISTQRSVKGSFMVTFNFHGGHRSRIHDRFLKCLKHLPHQSAS